MIWNESIECMDRESLRKIQGIHQGVEKDMIYLHSFQSAEFFCNDIGNETDVFRPIKLLYFHTFPIFARQS